MQAPSALPDDTQAWGPETWMHRIGPSSLAGLPAESGLTGIIDEVLAEEPSGIVGGACHASQVLLILLESDLNSSNCTLTSRILVSGPETWPRGLECPSRGMDPKARLKKPSITFGVRLVEGVRAEMRSVSKQTRDFRKQHVTESVMPIGMLPSGFTDNDH